MKQTIEKSALLALEAKALTDETLKNFEVGQVYTYKDYRFLVVEKVGRDNGSPLWSVDLLLTNEATIAEEEEALKAAKEAEEAVTEEGKEAAKAVTEEAETKLAISKAEAEAAVTKGYLKSIGDFKKLVGCTYKKEYSNKGTGKIIILSAEDIKKATDAKKGHFTKAADKVSALFASVLPNKKEAEAEETEAEAEAAPTEETTLQALKALTDAIKATDKAKQSVLDKTTKLADAKEEKAKAKAEKALQDAETKAKEAEEEETEATNKALKSLLWFASEIFADETEKALTRKAIEAEAAKKAAEAAEAAKKIQTKAKEKKLTATQTQAFNMFANASEEELKAFMEFMKTQAK